MNKSRWKTELPLHIMILPAAILVLIYSYGPMLGVYIAFQRFIPAKGMFGSHWVGLKNFIDLYHMPDFSHVIFNTVFMAFFKMLGGIVVPVFFALLLNEVKNAKFKRSFQTLIYLPNFLSWVIMAAILADILSPSDGIINRIIMGMGVKPVYFLGSSNWFPFTMIVSDIWKGFGFGTVVYLAALTGIDPELYEAAIVDGAGRWRQTLSITLPGLKGIIVLMAVLSLGNILNAGFDQIFNLYSPQVYSTGDILDTMVYRLGIEQAQFSIATAVGLFKSLVSLVFVVASYYMADKFANYRVF